MSIRPENTRKSSAGGGRIQRLFQKKSSTKLSIEVSKTSDGERVTLAEPLPVRPSDLAIGNAGAQFQEGRNTDSPFSETLRLGGHGSDSSPGSTPGAETPTYTGSSITGSQVSLANQIGRFVTEKPLRSGAASPAPPSSSKLRWEQLRQHILLTPSNSSVSGLPYASSSASQSQPDLSSRPHTPKPSRFARLGFRHLVDSARENVIVDEATRRFEDDIRKACWTIRFDDAPLSNKHVRHASQGTIASSLYLPFVSNTSVAATVNNNYNPPGSVSVSAVNSNRGIIDRQTTGSLLTRQISSAHMANLHSLILTRAKVTAGYEGENHFLPLENEILSALSVAFQTDENINSDIRRLAIDSFQLLSNAWKTVSPEAELERYLWCCKACLTVSSEHRARLLRILSGLLSSSRSILTTPVALRTIIPALVILLPRCSNPNGLSPDYSLVKDMINKIFDGRYGHLDMIDLEQKYGAPSEVNDTEDEMRRAICMEAILRCLEYGSEMTQRWILRNALEQFWPQPPQDILYSPLMTKIIANKNSVFLRSSSRLVLRIIDSRSANDMDASVLYRIMSTRVLLEMQGIEKGQASSLQESFCRCVLYLSPLNCPEQSEILSTLSTWIDAGAGWGPSLAQALKGMINTCDWSTCIYILRNLVEVLPVGSSRIISSWIIPDIFNRVLVDTPSFSDISFTSLLKTFSELHPQTFFRPLFLCAASNKESVVVSQLRLIMLLVRFMPEFLTRDPEMISVALMSDNTSKPSESMDGADGNTLRRAEARLGQCVIMFEVLCRIRNLRLHPDKATNTGEQSHAYLIKFVANLESRLGILLNAKERRSLIPIPQRLLMSGIFLEIRLYTRSLKTATWLPRIFAWLAGYQERVESPLDWGLEGATALKILKTVYDSSGDDLPNHSKRFSLPIFATKPENKISSNGAAEAGWSITDLSKERQNLLATLPEDPVRLILELLVAISNSLTQEDYTNLGPTIWSNFLESNDPKIVAAASFLVMQCAEKVPESFIAYVRSSLASPESQARHTAVRRLDILFSWRYQILSQTFISDRAHRRPFKLARSPIAFVPTDVGTSAYVNEESQPLHDSQGNALPLDLRRRLLEIGWTADQKSTDQRIDWSTIPITLLSSLQFDKLAQLAQTAEVHASEISRSPSPSSPALSNAQESQLIRKNSSSSNLSTGNKKRPVLVLPLLPVFIDLAVLTLDEDFLVADAARNLILDFMREDPSTLSRPIMDILSSRDGMFDKAVASMRAFLHSSSILPPTMSHHLFNHIVGFLKYISRESDSAQVLQYFASVLPIVSRLAGQINGISVRDIRRAKIEVFLFPSGRFWFPENSPLGPMFPRSLLDVSPLYTSSGLVCLSVIRMSQNLLFLKLLERNPQDVLIVRKSMGSFSLPDNGTITDASRVDFLRFLPRKLPPDVSGSENKTDDVIRLFSATLARSHLLLTIQLFRSMTRHLSDREDLFNNLSGVNLILLNHGKDIGIVGLAMLAYMVASARFRRLMASGSSFTIFLPTLLKVYCETKEHIGVKSAIEYAARRFYAIHDDTFIIQVLDVVAYILQQSEVDQEWFAECAYQFISALTSVNASTVDAAGIQDVNDSYEKEIKLATVAEEQPQALAAASHYDNPSSEKSRGLPNVVHSENKRFKLDTLVRMLVTVIAHDPTIKRAEYLLKVFCSFTGQLYLESSTIRSLVRDSLEALASVLIKLPHKNRLPEATQPQHSSSGMGFTNRSNTQAIGGYSVPSDFLNMRQDYIRSLVTYMSSGDLISAATLQQGFEIARTVLSTRDSLHDSVAVASNYCNSLARGLVSRDDLRLLLSYLKEASIMMNMYGTILDLTETFQALCHISSNSSIATNPAFTKAIVSQFCVSCLDTCEVAASENLLLGLNYRPSFVSLLCQCVVFTDTDVLQEMCNRPSSPGYLGGILVPFALTLKTTSQLAPDYSRKDSRKHTAHVRAWSQLLAYTLTLIQDTNTARTVQRSNSISSLDRSRTEDRHNASPISVAGVTLGLQLLKIIIVRAETDISNAYSQVWVILASVLTKLLEEGSAFFATPAQPSPATTPMLSPYLTPSYSHPNLSRPSSPSMGPPSPSAVSEKALIPPRVVDYLLWSLLEFLCLYRSPLLIHMRLFMKERAHKLHHRLKADQTGDKIYPVNRFSALARSRTSSAFVTPNSSPRLGPSISLPMMQNLSSLSPLDTEASSPSASFQLTHGEVLQSSPSGLSSRIRHLGPNYRPTGGKRTSSVSSRDSSTPNLQALMRSKTITEPGLILQTYKRIRTVQTFLGHNTLLPLEGAGEDFIFPWSKVEALENIAKETEMLINEFKDEFTTREPGFDLIHSSSVPLASEQ